MVAENINRKILKLAFPNILSNLTVPLLGMVDIALSGHLDNSYAIGAIAVGTTVFNLIYWNFSFLRMGTTGLTAQSNGKGDTEAMGRNLSQSVCIALIASIIILALQKPLLSLSLSVLVLDEHLTNYVTTYYSILIWGAPALLCTYALNGWLIGMQNTWLPMVISIVTNVTNIAVSAGLVLCGNMGISGIAIGTLVSQCLGVILLAIGAFVLYIRKGHVVLPRYFSDIKVDLGGYFGTNIHIFLRTFLLATVSLFFTYSGSHQGAMVLAGNALLYQFFTFFSYFIDGFAFAGEALVGHYYGMKERAFLKKSIRLLVIWGAGLAVVSSLLYLIFGNDFLAILTDKTEIISFIQPYLPWVYIIPIMGFLAFIYDGVFVGVTATREMFISMLVAVVVFCILYYISPFADINHSLWFAFVIYLLIRGIVQLFISKRLEGIGCPFLYTYYLSIGSTIMDNRDKINMILKETFPNGLLSSFTTSKDITGRSEKVYLNSVMRIESSLTLSEIQTLTKQMEAECGRDRASNEVALDIDVVLQDGHILREKDYSRDYFQNGYKEISHI